MISSGVDESFIKYHSLIGQMLIARYDLESLVAPDFGGIQNVILNGEVNTSMEEGSSSFKSLQKVVEAIKNQINGLVTIDYEGGRICRWGGKDMPSLPSAYVLAREPECLEKAGEIMGRQLAALKIDMLLGPVADSGGVGCAFPSRCYGDSPEEIVKNVGFVLDGLKKTRVFTCGKHYPNHGAVRGDSHDELPESPFDLETFESKYLPQFDQLAGRVDAVMTAHIFVKKWDENHPATFSKTILDRLREKGFDGIIMTDSLTMGAVENKYSKNPIEPMVDAILAGANMLIVGDRPIEELKALHDDLAERAVKDKVLRRQIRASAKKIDKLMEKRSLKEEAAEDLDLLAKEAECFAREISERAVFIKKPFVHPPFVHSERALVLAPKLLINKVQDGYERAYSASPNILCWGGILPTKEEIQEFVQKANYMQDVLVITYNGDTSPAQQELVVSLDGVRARVCEANFTQTMAWVPDFADAVAICSADAISLSSAFKKLGASP